MEEKKEKIEKNNTPNMKKNHTAIIALIILILVVALGFRGYYFYKKMQVSNPIKITTDKIKAFGNESTKVVSESDFFKKNKVTKMTIDGNIADYKFNIEGGFDLKNNIAQLLMEFDEKSNNLLYIDSKIDSTTALFQVAKNSNNYKLSTDFTELFNSLLDYSDLLGKNYSEKFTNYFAESFELCFTKDDFTKSKDKITVFDKEMDVTKYEKTFNKKDVAKLIETYIDKIAKDDDIIDMIVDSVKSTGEKITKAEVKEGLYSARDSISSSLEETNIKYTIYVKGIDVVRLSFNLKDADTNINVDTYKNKTNISVVSGKNKIDIDYNEKNNEYSIAYNKMTVVTGTYEEKTKKNDVSVNITFSIPLLAIEGKLNTRVFVPNSLDEKTFNNPLDVSEAQNAAKLMKELENNDFLTGLIESLDDFGSLFQTQNSWTSIDGIDL